MGRPGAGPRSYTLLLAADGTGVAGEPGSTFEPAAATLQCINAVEAEPVLRQITELQRENAELREEASTLHQGLLDMAKTLSNGEWA